MSLAIPAAALLSRSMSDRMYMTIIIQIVEIISNDLFSTQNWVAHNRMQFIVKYGYKLSEFVITKRSDALPTIIY